LDDAGIVQLVKDSLENRLENHSNEDSNDSEEELDDDDNDEEELDDDDNDEDDEDENEVELGKSIVESLLQKLEEPAWVEANIQHLKEMAKPATVIDGQHRLLGAASCERGIPFLACAIYDCPWEEQVFQFTIVNYKQKGIPDQFITANAALSLTTDELAELQDRLVQAKVKVVEYELMKTVQFNPASPFHARVNLTEKNDSALIGYKTMIRIANGWYKAGAPFFQQLLPKLYPEIAGKSAKSLRKEKWKDSDWSDFFLDYWTLVKEQYGHEESNAPFNENGEYQPLLWHVGESQLMVAIVLFEFQATFFESLSDQDEEFFEVEGGDVREQLRLKLKKRAQKLFESFPSKLFQTEWKEKSLNTSAGRSALQSVFGEMKKTKGKFNFKNSNLVKGQS
jgi:hypothetical protein